MSKIELQPTPTALWHALVNDAEQAAGQQLDHELESYLVYLLMRYSERPDVARQVMALEFLQSQQTLGQQRETRLQNVADGCLLYSGLYPVQTERRRVSASYFVDLGRSAYDQLAGITAQSLSALYQHLADGFVQLMDVLTAIRQFSHSLREPSALQLCELWQQTGSQPAQRQLQQLLDTLPRRDDSGHHH